MTKRREEIFEIINNVCVCAGACIFPSDTMLTAACALTLLLAVSVNSHGPPGVPPRQGGGPPPGMQGGQQQQPRQQQFHQQPDVAEGHAHERGKNFKFQSEIHNAE